MTTFSATYSPEDNKLRLYASSRLDADLYARVKNAGFKWAPKQEVFVAPMWTPGREDLALELAGEIGDEDKGLLERAEERAERFEDYSDSREREAESARKQVAAIADHIPFGQPILVGHHSERRARKDADRIHDGMRRAVQLWETSEYWTRRAVAAKRHAAYKQLPGVRYRRIKGLESELRSQERDKEKAETFLTMWSAENMTLETALRIANMDYVTIITDPAAPYGNSLWSLLQDGKLTPEDAARHAIAAKHRTIASCNRWIAHYTNRINYERAMLAEDGGLVAENQDVQVGGKVRLSGDEWFTVLRVNKRDGKIISLTLNRRYHRVCGIEEVKGYQAPTTEAAAKVKAATKLPPQTNYPGEGVAEITREEWNKIPKDYKGTRVIEATETTARHRVRVALGAYVLKGEKDMNKRHSYPYVFITDAPRVDAPAVVAPSPAPAAEANASEPETEAAPEPVEAVTPCGYQTTETTCSKPNVSGREPIACGTCDTGTAQNLAAKVAAEKPGAAFEAMREQLRQGVQVVSVPQLFPTPSDLVARMLDLADIEEGHSVLEPNAGTGNIVRGIMQLFHLEQIKLTAVEIHHGLAATLSALLGDAATTRCADFLALRAADIGHFDRIVMNPPFANSQDIAHIEHAVTLLKPGTGRLVAICFNGPRQRARLMPLVEHLGGEWQDLPPGTFKDSHTSVNTALLVIEG